MKKSDYFFSGSIFAIGFYTFIQDWLGLEGYIQFIRDNWIDMHWIAGITIMCFSFFYPLINKGNDEI